MLGSSVQHLAGISISCVYIHFIFSYLWVQPFPVWKIVPFDVEDRNKVGIVKFCFLSVICQNNTSFPAPEVVCFFCFLLLVSVALKDFFVTSGFLSIFSFFLALPFLILFITGIAIISNEIWTVQLIYLFLVSFNNSGLN